MKAKSPADREVAATLGPAKAAWDGVIAALAEKHGPIDPEWKPSKLEFGWMCLLRHKKRTLVYLMPEKGRIAVAVVLGERAVALALASGLPESIKTLIREARPYVEGRGIRFSASSAADVAIVSELVALKTAPATKARSRPVKE